MRAVVSTGSNMEDSRAHLAAVVHALQARPDVVVVGASSLYVTAPWGGVEQPDFFNQVLLVDTQLSPPELLAVCQGLERDAHRRHVLRWGPRTLDVDIVDIEGYTSSDPVLTVPHPRAHAREFVLRPWLEVDPDATLRGEPVRDILAQLEPQGVSKL